MEKIGVVLLVHGSRGDGANDGVYEVARTLKETSGYGIVEVGFMQRNFPTIEESTRSCIEQGANTVLLVPYFLHWGLHMQHDLPETVELLRVLHPEARLAFGVPFAHHPSLVAIVRDRIEECRSAIDGAAGVEPRAESDEADEVEPSPGASLRTGYTTGACAAAAAKAAALVLPSQKRLIQVDIPLPIGKRAQFAVDRCDINPERSRCSVIKDAGDDPDVTNGAEICASVEWTSTLGIAIEGGQGVGRVTKPGLGIPIGEAAINPVPRQMIAAAVEEALGPALAQRGVLVTISVPAGEAYAKRTLNGRLGIKGGISILGTTGIVVPYSNAAFTATISQALSVASAAGYLAVALSSGRRTERYGMALLDLPEEACIQAGDYVDFALEECVRRKMNRATLCLMAGKMVKIAAGQLQTHVSRSAVELSHLALIASDAGAGEAVARQIAEANTARQALEILQAAGLTRVLAALCQRAAESCRSHVGGGIEVECLLFDYDGNLLGRSDRGR